jgi:hypothetical protein
MVHSARLASHSFSMWPHTKGEEKNGEEKNGEETIYG